MTGDAPNDLQSINLRDAEDDDIGEVMAGMPHGREIGMRLHRSAQGHAHLSVPYSEKLVGDPQTGVLHGGVVTALLDTACGASVLSATGNPLVTATLDLRIDYMRPATAGQAVHARAECYRMTRSIAFARAVAYHTDPNDPIASAAGSFIVEAPAEEPAKDNTMQPKGEHG